MLSDFIALNFRTKTQVGHGEIMFTVKMSNDRSQTVLVTLANKRDFQLIEVRSKCAAIQDAMMVRSALRRNLSTQIGGLSLDTSTQPNSIDFVQRLVSPNKDGPNLPELLNTIALIASQADQIEQKFSNSDCF